ncbi:MAG: response regulator transcription factor [Desulfofustis sp.]|nr:response regulator transcription factor [Desulfofustis sp.]
MKVLVAEDEYTTRLMIQVCLEKWGYRVESVADGKEAWELVNQETGPEVAILDWEMPEINGLELCRRIKALNRESPIHVIMLTARDTKRDILQGFDAGADDYITKPFNDDELRARIRVAERIVRIQSTLHESLQELRRALDLVEALQTTVMVCKNCQRVEGDDGQWRQLGQIAEEDMDFRFSKKICPQCRAEQA